MDAATKMLSTFILENGIKISTIAEKTQISYGKLWTSLAKDGTRDLRADEFLAVCAFIGKSPYEFYALNTA